MKTLNWIALAILVMSPMAASAGCEDGIDMALHGAKRAVAKELGRSHEGCQAYVLASYGANGKETHYVDVNCSGKELRAVVGLQEHEDAVCSTQYARALKEMPRNLCRLFPDEASKLKEHGLKLIESSQIKKRYKVGMKPTAEQKKLLELVFGNDRDWTLKDFIAQDGGFEKYVEPSTGLVLWRVFYYPGDNEVGALVEEYPEYGFEDTDSKFRVIADVSDSWIKCRK